MPSVSKSQQRLMGMAWAYQKGDLDISDLPKSQQKNIKEIAKNMKKKDLSDFAHTKRKKLTCIADSIIKQSNIINEVLEKILI